MFKVFFKKDLPVNWMRDNGCRSNWTNAPRLCLLILSFFSFLLRMRKIVLHLSCSLRFASAAALATAVLHIAERTTINLWRFFLFAVCLEVPRSTHLSFDGIVRQSGSRIKSLIMPPPVICSVCDVCGRGLSLCANTSSGSGRWSLVWAAINVRSSRSLLFIEAPPGSFGPHTVFLLLFVLLTSSSSPPPSAPAASPCRVSHLRDGNGVL